MNKSNEEIKMKEIEEEAEVLFQKIDSLSPEAQKKFLVDIRPIIRKLEKLKEKK